MGYYVGIDLGTTFTGAAVHRDGRSSTFPLGSQTAAMPSVVLLREDQTELTGEAAARRALSEPERVAREFKRRLGDSTPIIVGGSPYSAEQLMARLLSATISEIAKREGGAPDRVALTHPANWGPYKVDLLLQAVRIAGIPADRIDLLTEPEAAAISYASQERVEPGQIVAVYDLGGGTFDAAVLRRTDRGFEIIGRPEGIERMGGIDFDAAVFAHVSRALDGKLQELDPEDPMVLSGVARLREECVDAKIALSSDTDATIPVLLPNLTTEVRITRNEFENLIRPSLSDSIAAMHRALDSAGIAAADVSKVLLVGGSSRIPLISQMVSSELGRPVAVDADPKHAVALGAAAFAAGALSNSSGGSHGGAAAGTAGAAAVGALGGVAAGASLPPTTPTPAVPPQPAAHVVPPQPQVANPVAAHPGATAQQPQYTQPTTQMPAQPGFGAEPAASAAFPSAAPTAPQAPMGPGDQKSGASKTPLLIGAVVALIALGVAGFFVFGGGGEDGTADAPPATDVQEQEIDEEPDSTIVEEPTVTEPGVEPVVTLPVDDPVDTAGTEETTIDDASIQSAAGAAVSAISPDIGVSVSNGVVTLTGQADDATASAALGVAGSVDGVVSVVDSMSRLVADEICTDDIRSRNRFACITTAEFDGTTLFAAFDFGDDGTLFDTEGGFHMHFYPDSIEAVDAGAANGIGVSNGQGPWVIHDGPEVFSVDPIREYNGVVPTRLCVVIANADHSISDLDSGNCWPVVNV